MNNKIIKFHLKCAIENKKYPQAYYELAKIFLEENNLKDAMISLKNAISLGTEIATQLKVRINSLLKKKQFTYAKSLLYKSEKLNHEISLYLALLADIYYKSNDLANAKKYAHSSIKKYPNQSISMNILGWIYLINKKWKLSAKWLEKSLDIKYINAEAHLGLAQVKKNQNKIKEATHHYLTAKDIQPTIKNKNLELMIKKYSNI